ncbi:MAG: hypothetical protein J6A21_10465 [Lentisphaeria bacterium]|nr:hypothetical protein [Lentisphaeria bacterium]
MRFLRKMKYGKTGGLLGIALILAGTFSTVAVLQGQNARASATNSQIWSLWRKGFEDFENAELKMISRKYPEAIAHYTAALESFKRVRELNPKWNKDVIEYRINRAERRIEVAREKIRLTLPAPARKAIAQEPSAGAYQAASRRLNEENAALRRQLDDTKKSLSAARVQAATGETAARQVKGLLLEREKREKEIALLKLKFENLEKLRQNATKEYDKILLEEKTRNAALAKVIQDQNKEMMELRKKLQEVSYDKSSLDARIRNLQKAAEEERTLAAAQLKQEKSEKDSVTKKLEKSEEKVLLTEKELLQAKTDNEKLRGRISALQTSGNASDMAVKQTQSENADLRKRLEEVSGELNTFKKAKSADADRIASLEKKVASLQSDLAANIRQRNEYGNMNDSFVKRIASLEKELEQLKKENRTLAAESKKASAERDEFAEKINRNLPVAKELEELRRQNQLLTEKERELRGKIASLEEENRLAGKKAEESAKRLAEQSAKRLEELKAKVAQLDAAKTAADARIAVLTAEKAALDKKVAETNNLLKQKEESDKALAELRARLAEKEKELAASSASREESRQVQEKDVQAYKEEIRKAVKKQMEAESALAAAQKKNEEVFRKQSEAESALAAARKKNEEVLRRQSEAESALAAARKKNEEVLRKQSEAESALAASKEENAVLAKRNTALQDEVRTLSALQVQIRKLTLERDMAEKALAAVKGKGQQEESSAAKQETGRIIEENARLSTRLKSAEKEIAELKEKSGERETLLRQNAVLRTKEARLTEAEKRLAELKDKTGEMDQLHQQVASLRAKEAKLKETEKRLAELEKKAAVLEQKEKSLEASFVKKELLTQAEAKILVLQKEAGRLKEAAEMEKERSARLARQAEESSKLEQENRTKILSQEESSARLRSDLASSEALRKTLEAEKAKHLQEIRKQEEDIARLTADMEKVVLSRNSALAERKKLLAELALQKNTGKAADEKIMEAEKRFLALQQKMEESEKRHAEDLRKSLASQQETIAALKKVNNEYIVAIGNANIARERTEKENARLKSELEAATNKAIAALKYQEDSRQLAAARRELDQSKKTTAELLSQMKLLQSNLEKIGKENLTLHTRSEQLGKEYLRLASERDTLRARAAETAALKEINEKQKTALGSLRKEVADISEKQRALELKYRKVSEELAKLKGADDPLVVRIQQLLASAKGEKDRSTVDQEVLDALVLEIGAERKKQRDALAASAVARNEAIRERNRANTADDSARKAHLEAVRVQAEMAVLKKDIEDGNKPRPSPEAYAEAENAGLRAATAEDAVLPRTTLPISALHIPFKGHGKKSVVAVKSTYDPITRTSAEAPLPGKTEKQEEGKSESSESTSSGKQQTAETKTASSSESSSATASATPATAEEKRFRDAMKAGGEAEQKKDYSMALWHYWQAVDASPRDASPYMALARLNLKRNEKDAAEKAYQKALQLGAVRDTEMEKEFGVGTSSVEQEEKDSSRDTEQKKDEKETSGNTEQKKDEK